MGQSSLRAQRKRSSEQEKAENRKEYFSKCFSLPPSPPLPVSLWPIPITEQQGQPQDQPLSAHLPRRRTPARSRTASRRKSPGRSPPRCSTPRSSRSSTAPSSAAAVWTPSTGWQTTSTSSASPWSSTICKKATVAFLDAKISGANKVDALKAAATTYTDYIADYPDPDSACFKSQDSL